MICNRSENPSLFFPPWKPSLTLGSPTGRNVLPKLREKLPSSSQRTRGRSLWVPASVAGSLMVSLLPPRPALPWGQPQLVNRFAVAATVTFKTQSEKRETPHSAQRKRGSRARRCVGYVRENNAREGDLFSVWTRKFWTLFLSCAHAEYTQRQQQKLQELNYDINHHE